MYYFGRTFITGEARAAFLEGARSALNRQQAKKVELVHLSVRKEHGFLFVINSTWARPEQPSSHTFRLSLTGDFPKTPEIMTNENWFTAGAALAADMWNWIDNDDEFVRLNAKAEAQQYDVWKTSQWYDVAQDLINDLELHYNAHLHGKLHWRARKALSDRIESLLALVTVTLEKQHAEVLAQKIQEVLAANDSKSLKKPAKKEIANVGG